MVDQGLSIYTTLKIAVWDGLSLGDFVSMDEIICLAEIDLSLSCLNGFYGQNLVTEHIDLRIQRGKRPISQQKSRSKTCWKILVSWQIKKIIDVDYCLKVCINATFIIF